jgi:hypothetical protein
MAVTKQLTVDEAALAFARAHALDSRVAERPARDALRAQIARLERELTRIVASGFPHISVSPASEGAAAGRLLTLEELELARDRLVLRIREAQGQAQQRLELELRSKELLEQMKLQPGRYKFMRLPLEHLGQGKCGAWEVRPRFGLLGMLAGWWELKLSSGCPLATGRAPARPAPM